MSRLLVPTHLANAPRPTVLKAEFDPDAERKKIMAMMPDIGAVKIFGQRVLVAKFIRDRLFGDIISSEQTKKEDRWQGKIGLVLAIGHLAFKSDAMNDFGPDTVKVGDWVTFSYSDGHDVDYRPPGKHEFVGCKILKDVNIDGLVERPDIFF